MIWLTGDTQFGHAGIIDMVGRPFADVQQMDDALVTIWNSLVGRRDVVWHLGDFSLGPPGTAARVFRRLHGIKHLLRGNHDGNDVMSSPWDSVSDLASQKVDGVRLVMCHYPLLSWRGSSRNHGGHVHSIQCHGHVHGTPSNSRVLHQDTCRVDVGVDMHSMAPVAAEAMVAGVRMAAGISTGKESQGSPDAKHRGVAMRRGLPRSLVGAAREGRPEPDATFGRCADDQRR